MKKILAFIIIFVVVILTFPAYAASPKYSASPFSIAVGPVDLGTVVALTLNSAYVNYVSGDASVVRHQARETQTNGAFKIYAYCSAASGSPTSVALILESAIAPEDVDRPRPGSSATSTSSTVDVSGCTTAQWVEYDFTGVTLVLGDFYFGLITNNTADPVTNTVNILTRGAVDMVGSFTSAMLGTHAGISTSDGFSTDGTAQNGLSPMVFCYASGNCYGNPYVATFTHASNQNYRGVRWTPTEDVQVQTWGSVTADGNMNSLTIAQGSTVVMLNDNLSQTHKGRYTLIASTTVTLTGGLEYDFLLKSIVNDTLSFSIYSMGPTPPPADVIATAGPLIYVDGTTLGSLTASTTAIGPLFIGIADNPAISGGGGTNILGNVIQ